jgi:hypothetical protein
VDDDAGTVVGDGCGSFVTASATSGDGDIVTSGKSATSDAASVVNCEDNDVLAVFVVAVVEVVAKVAVEVVGIGVTGSLPLLFLMLTLL